MTDHLDLLRGLRATRHFANRPVAEDVLTEILDVARWTGSARNRQPWRVAVITAQHERRRLARLGAFAGVLEHASTVILLGIDYVRGGTDGEFDAGRFAQSLMLAAHAGGLGTCPVSFFPSQNVRVATACAGLSAPWEVRRAIALGYPAAPDHPAGARPAIATGRIPLETLVTRGLTQPTLYRSTTKTSVSSGPITRPAPRLP